MSLCNYTPFNLDELYIIGGNYKEINVRVADLDNGGYFSNENIDLNFSLVEYKNRFGSPIITQTCTPSSTDKTLFTLILNADDTSDLCGKFIYQLSVQAPNGKQESFQGIMTIDKNINPNAFKPSS